MQFQIFVQTFVETIFIKKIQSDSGFAEIFCLMIHVSKSCNKS